MTDFSEHLNNRGEEAHLVLKFNHLSVSGWRGGKKVDKRKQMRLKEQINSFKTKFDRFFPHIIRKI